MVVAHLTPVILATLLFGAHHLRAGNMGAVAACLGVTLLLFVRRGWVPLVVHWLLIGASLSWAAFARDLVEMRIALGEPWLRLVIILAAVAVLTFGSTFIFRTETMKQWYAPGMKTRGQSATAFLLTFALLAIVQLKVSPPMLLADRFWSGFGWLEAFLLATYAAWIVEKMLDTRRQPTWRLGIWLLFSLVFFGQLAIGLGGFETFLMSGELHYPIPALIVAGPLYRGGGLFMPLLLAATVLLVGPAWCSHLCYIGALDNYAALARKRPGTLPRWTRHARLGILIAVLVLAVILRFAGVPSAMAGGVALGFGIAGVAIMVFWSRRVGTMVHCTVYCPIGLIANLLGKVSPFRIRIKEGCNQCGKCSKACRYDALDKLDIERKKPGLTCTLCGDCVGRCKDEQIVYGFFRWNGSGVRSSFIVLVVSLHAVFLGVARI